MKKRLMIFALFFSMFCGCTKIDETTYILPEDLDLSEETTTFQTFTSATEITETIYEITTANAPNDLENITTSEEIIYSDTEWDASFYANSLFYGDSICRALSVYNNLIDPERVAAAGGVGARNIDEFTFLLNDIEYNVSSCAKDFKPDKAFVWLGINDINMTEKDEFVKNMEHVCTEIHDASPDSDIIIIGMTPTTRNHKWGANSVITDYNAATSEFAENTDLPVTYIDVTSAVSDDEGYLTKECDGGDGLHLTELALQKILSKIYHELKATPHKDCVRIATSDFSSDCTKISQAG